MAVAISPLLRVRVPRALLPRTTGVVAVLMASLVLGGLTSFAQTVLPFAIAPLANSVGGWTLVTAALLALLRERVPIAASTGAGSFVLLVLGYRLVSDLRGFPDTEELFLVAGVLAGPFVGVAATWLRARGLRAALGAGLLAGIGLGEGAYGLARIVASTGWFFWSIELVGSLVLLAVVLLRRAARGRDRVLGAALAVGLALAFVAVCSSLG